MIDPAPAAIVTGSSSGIGKAVAIRLACEGYHVALNYSSDDSRAEDTLAECNEIDPESIMIKADLRDPDEVKSLIRQTADRFGRLDVLINNAARVIDKPALDMSLEDWGNVMDVNLRGTFLAAQSAARIMLAQEGGGSIVNIGASTGIRGRRNGVNTCASKAGIMIMTQCLALEWAPDIRVNTIVPGLILTPETEQRFGLDDPTEIASRARNVPLGRLGQPEDVADGVMLLLSPEARFMTGQKIVIDGGQNMW
jgi:3-oxoacyl-[acyl-carrier protein] reductase